MKAPSSRQVAAVRVAQGAPQSLADTVAVEEPLEIRVAEEPVAITMRTPGDDANLAFGFLFAEGIIRSIHDVGSAAHCGRLGDEGYGNTIEITPAPGVSLDIEKVQASKRGTLTTAACGVCGRRSIDDLLSSCGLVPEGPRVKAQLLHRSIEQLSSSQKLFKKTGGVHAAAALDAEGNLLFAFEDVGRHNAVDKVVGALLHAGAVGSKRSGHAHPAILVVSGRTSFEIIQKAAMAEIPIVASVSAPSSLAIDLAEKARITLAAFVRGDALTVYSHPERLLYTA
jgi:FdhD protein